MTEYVGKSQKTKDESQKRRKEEKPSKIQGYCFQSE